MSKTNKSKFINKQGVSQFLFYSQKGQQLNERDVYTINNHETEGLIKFGVVHKGSGFQLIYNLAGLVNFRDFLINPLNRESFARILENILCILKNMQSAFFNQRGLLLDVNHVMVNPATQKIMFIYVPVLGYDSEQDLRTFLLDIIQMGTFVREEDSNYVKEYIRILNNGINFSIFELEEYVKGLTSESGYRAEKSITCFKCGTQLGTGTIFCSVCGAKVSGNTGEISNKSVYDPIAGMRENNRKNELEEIQRQKELQSRKEAEERRRLEEKNARELEQKRVDTQGLSIEAKVEEYQDTMLLGMYESMYEEKRYLIRTKNKERIDISTDVFRMGKSKQECDYAILDNSTISRRHAEIIKQENGYFVVDLGSTNKTYVNGAEVKRHKALESGDKVTLSNEEFIFYVE